MKFLTWVPLAVLAIVPIDRLPELGLCGFRWLTGLPCPLCGLTHGLLYLLHAQWTAAIGWNLLAPVVALLLLGYPLVSPQWWQIYRTRTIFGVVTLFGVYGVWRWCAILVWKV